MKHIYSPLIIPIAESLSDPKSNLKYVIRYSSNELRELGDKIVNVIRSTVERSSEMVVNACGNKPDLERDACILQAISDLIVYSIRRYFEYPLEPPVKDLKGAKIRALSYWDYLIAYRIADLFGDRELDEIFGQGIVRWDMNFIRGLWESYISKYIPYDELYKKPQVEDDVEKIYREHFLEKMRILAIPADTRPPYSISKLVPHLLLTSAIAYSLYISELSRCSPVNMLEAQILRLASILHDLGKPYAWAQMLEEGGYRSHAKDSMRIAKEHIFSRLGLGKGLEEVLEAISKIIEYHHSPERLDEFLEINVYGAKAKIHLKKLGEILKKADELASGIDRLSAIVEKLLNHIDIISKLAGIDADKLKDLLGLFKPYMLAKERWKKWLAIEDETIERFCEAVIKILRASLMLEPPKDLAGIEDRFRSLVSSIRKRLLEEDQRQRAKGAYIGLFDILKIQEFISRENIRGIIASSILVDMAISIGLAIALDKLFKARLPPEGTAECRIPLESLIIAGGGFAYVVLPQNIAKDATSIQDEFRRSVGVEGLKIEAVLKDLKSSWVSTSISLASSIGAQKMRLKKHTDEDLALDLILPYAYRCEHCGRNPAVKELGSPPRVEYVCEECEKLSEFGNNFYMNYRLSVLEGYGYGVAGQYRGKLRSIMERLMEWLSGAFSWETEQELVAVCKANGNLMSTIIASSLNISDLLFRSMRIDLSMKLGIISALAKLYTLCIREKGAGPADICEDLVIRCYSGILYVGGDDLMAVLPSRAALPLLLQVSKTFWAGMGTETQLSLGVAAAKPKHNIWNMIDSAQKLLDIAKGKAHKAFRYYDRSNAISFLAFIESETQLLPGYIEKELRTYISRELSAQPIIFKFNINGISELADDIRYIAAWMLPIDDAVKLSADQIVDEIYNMSLAGILAKLPERSLELSEKLRRASEAIDSAIELSHTVMRLLTEEGVSRASDAVYVLITALAREFSKSSDEKAETSPKIYRQASLLLMSMLKSTDRPRVPIYDLYTLAKIIKGG